MRLPGFSAEASLSLPRGVHSEARMYYSVSRGFAAGQSIVPAGFWCEAGCIATAALACGLFKKCDTLGIAAGGCGPVCDALDNPTPPSDEDKRSDEDKQKCAEACGAAYVWNLERCNQRYIECENLD